MSNGEVIDLVRNAILIILVVSSPILVLSVVVGLVIAVFQTVTSVQEQTLTFIPKLFVILGALVFFSYFIVAKLSDYTLDIFGQIPYLGR